MSTMTDIFQFYSSSAATPAPGKGNGESLSSTETYKELRKHVGWRRTLTHSAETPFTWKGTEWKTAEEALKKGELREVLTAKFEGNEEAKAVLLATGSAQLWHAPRGGKERWDILEDIREGIKRNISSTAEMEVVPKKKKNTSKKVSLPSAEQGQEQEQEQKVEAFVPDEAGDTVTVIPTNVRATGVEEKAEVQEVDSKKSAIRFCTVCDNYLYLQVEGEKQVLQRICRNCGFRDTEDQGGLVSEMHIEQRAAEGYTLINEFTLKDKRLPHLYNTMKCINDKCPSALPGKESDIVYIKYDIENLRYIYMCYICQATWRSRR
jgi:hypothetical protein